MGWGSGGAALGGAVKRYSVAVPASSLGGVATGVVVGPLAR